MVLVTDEKDGVIKGEECLSPAYFEIASSNIISQESEPGRTRGSRGNAGSKLCCADHIHLHSKAWYKDPAIVSIERKLDAVEEATEEKIAKETFNLVAWLTDIGTTIVRYALYVVAVMSGGAVNVAPHIINFLIRMLNRMLDLNIKEMEVDGVKVDIEELMEKLEVLIQ